MLPPLGTEGVVDRMGDPGSPEKRAVSIRIR